MPTIDLSQGTVHYRVAGLEDSTAPPVVFVHGLLTDGTLWSRVTSRLAARRVRSYAPDWPLGSHPFAMDADADLSPRGVARLVVEFLERMGLEDVTLVGNDTGGALCQLVLDEDPRRVGRLVLTNCDGLDVFPPAVFKPLFALLRSERRARFLAGQMRVTALRQSPLGFGRLAHDLPADLTRAWVDPGLRDGRVIRDLARFVRAVQPTELVDVATRLDRFLGAVTLVWGADDRAFTTELGERLQRRFMDATFVSVPASRTFVPLDAPQALTDQILATATRARAELADS